MSKKTAIIYWLIPAQPYRELFREFISILAKQLDAPRFEPHLTVCVASRDHGAAKRILRQLGVAPIRLRVRGTGYSSKFTQTLFIRFAPTKSIDRLVVHLTGAAKPVRDPHVSLLYKKLSARTRRELAATIKLPFRNVLFDSIKVARCVSATKTRADVDAWRVIATKKLRG